MQDQIKEATENEEAMTPMFDLKKGRIKRNKTRDSNNSSPLMRHENPIKEGSLSSDSISDDETP